MATGTRTGTGSTKGGLERSFGVIGQKDLGHGR